MVAAEFIYFLFLFYYMVVQVRGVRAQWAEMDRSILLPSHLLKPGLRQEGKGFLFWFGFYCPSCLANRSSVGPVSQSILFQEGTGLVLPRN